MFAAQKQRGPLFVVAIVHFLAALGHRAELAEVESNAMQVLGVLGLAHEHLGVAR